MAWGWLGARLGRGVAIVDGRLSRQMVAATGPEELTLAEAVRRIARVLDRPVALFRLPIWSHTIAALVFERTMVVPLVALARVRILAEGVAVPLPAAAPFGLKDCRCYARFARA